MILILIYIAGAILAGLRGGTVSSSIILIIGLLQTLLTILRGIELSASANTNHLYFEVAGITLSFGSVIILVHAINKYFTGSSMGFKRQISELTTKVEAMNKDIGLLAGENKILTDNFADMEACHDGIAAMGTSLDFNTLLKTLAASIYRFTPFTTGHFYAAKATFAAMNEESIHTDDFLTVPQVRGSAPRSSGSKGHERSIYYRESEHSVESAYLITRQAEEVAVSKESCSIINREILKRYNETQSSDIAEISDQAGAAHIIAPVILEHELLGLIWLTIQDKNRYYKERLTDLLVYFAMELKKLRLYETVKDLSIIDPLTGLYLRRYFDEKITGEIDRCIKNKSHLSLLMIDIDNFKHINDNYGHQAGDAIIKETAHILEHNARGIDLIARFGGDEFYIALPDTKKEDSLAIAQRIKQTIETTAFGHLEDTDLGLKLSASMGIAGMPQDAKSYSALVHCADKAMYHAKSSAKGGISLYSKGL